jgi:5-deoxy-5-amino-3-dehydroquinate synthase
VRRVRVEVPGQPYEVMVGAGVITELAPLLRDRRRVAIVSQAPIAEHHADAARGAVPDAEVYLIDDGEAAKSLATVESLCRRFADGGLLRGDAVIGLGGGVVGDVTGFAAAVYHRGIAVVHVPTSLLAMVDSAIGGKTGVNLPEGKNLVGAFHQPVGVVADIDTLSTLPEREYRSGLGEVAKYALLGDEAVAGLLRTGAAAIPGRDPGLLSDLVVQCATAKAAVVAADAEERTGARATLNYGHTLAHALEIVSAGRLSHGEAVAIGLVFAAELAGALGRLGTSDVEDHRALLESLGLPVRAPAGIVGGDLLAVMRRDKKAQGGLTFVLRGADGVEIVHDPPAPALESALRAVGVEGSA